MLQVQINQVKEEAAVVLADVKFKRYVLWWGAYFGIMVGLRVLGGGLGVLARWDWVWFLVGGMLGMFVSIADKLVYVYYTRPTEEVSVKVKDLIKNKEYKQALEWLWGNSLERARLATNNVLFLAAWSGLGLFIMTSSPSFLAKGLVLGVGLELLMGIYDNWNDKEALMGRLFWPIKRQVSEQELKVVVAVFGMVFLWLSMMRI